MTMQSLHGHHLHGLSSEYFLIRVVFTKFLNQLIY